MNITSPLLGHVARAAAAAAPSIYESDFQIPPVIQPVLSLRQILTRGESGAISTEQNTTHSALVLTTVANGAQQTPIVTILGTGIWEIVFQCFYTANFANVGVSPGAGLQMTPNVVSTNNYFISAFEPSATATVIQATVQSGKFIVEIGEAWKIQNNVSASGAAQTHSLLSSVLCSKLN